MNVVPLRPLTTEQMVSRMDERPPAVLPPKGPWICWRYDAALSGMASLTGWEELAYRRILDMIFSTGDRLHDDDRAMPAATKTGRQWKAVKVSLIAKGKIEIVDGLIRCPKATATCIETRTYVAQKKAASAARYAGRKPLENKVSDVAGDGPSDHPSDHPHGHPSYILPSEGKSNPPPIVPPRKRVGTARAGKPAHALGGVAYTDAFEIFWDQYPRGPDGRHRGSKFKSFRIWQTVVAREGVEPRTIYRALDDDIAGPWAGKDPQFIPYPTTWLNDRRWDIRSALDDQPEPAPEQPPAPSPSPRKPDDLFGGLPHG